MRARRSRRRIGNAARWTSAGLEKCDSAGDEGRRHARYRNVAGHALLQQEFGRLYHRFGVEMSANGAVVEHICQRNDHHTLMVRHKGTDHRVFHA